MNRGFLARAGMLLGRALAAFGLSAQNSTITPTPPPTGAAGLPTRAVLLSPTRRCVRILSPAFRKVKVLG